MENKENLTNESVENINEETFSSEIPSSTTEEEPDLEAAREELINVIRKKTPPTASDFILSTLTPIVNSLSASDCKNMADIINKKGLAGALMMGKRMKKKIQKDGGDLNEGRVK